MNNNVKLNLGFLTTASGRWPRELPRERHSKYVKWIKETFDYINLIAKDDITVNNDEVEEITEYFAAKRVDAVVLLIGAFTGDSAAVRIAEKLNVPLFIWALPEPPFNGGRLMSNALVSATMNCAALKRMDARYHFLFGSEDEEKTLKTLSTYLKVYHVVKRLKHTFLGLIGYRPTAFYSSTFDETLIRKTFGIFMEEQDLVALTTIAEEIDSTLIEQDVEQLSGSVDMVDVPEGYLENHSRTWHALRKLIDQFGFNALALKCWPEMGNMKMTPCAVISRFADEKFIIGCESDVNTTISLLVEQFFTDDLVFMSDLIKVDTEKNSVLLWHCGQASTKLHGSSCPRELKNHSLAGEGVALEGTLKPGRVTVCLFTDVAGKYRLFLATGEALPTEKTVRGVTSEIKLDSPVLDTVYKIGEEGIPHHYAVVWRDIADELRAMAEYLDIEVVEVRS